MIISWQDLIEFLVKMNNFLVLILSLSNAFLTTADLVNVVPKAEVIRNGSVVFPCATSFGDRYSVDWQHTPVGSTKTIDVFLAGYLDAQLKDKYKYSISRDRDKGQFNLTVMNAQPTDAGTYTCIDMDGAGEQRRTSLIVYDSQPLGTSNVSLTQLSICGDAADVIGLSCDVTYNGDERPELRWIQVFQNGTESEISDGTQDITRDRAFLRTAVIRVSPQMDGAYFRCQTKLRKYNWNSAELQVQYALPNRTIIELDKKTRVLCQVDTNRNCSYKWFLEDGKTHLSDSRTLDLSETSPGTFFCRANCAIRSTSCSVDGTTVHYSETDTSSSPGIFVAAALAIVMLIIGVVVLIKVLKRKLQRGADTIDEKDPLLKSDETLTPTPDVEKLIVRGISEMKFIYVIFQGKPFIRVYKTLDKFEKDRDIDLKQYLVEPWTLRSCEQLNSLYIADKCKNCIWKYDLSTNETDKIVTDLKQPHKFSVTLSGVIIVPKWLPETGLQIFKSDESGHFKSEVIELPEDMREPYDALLLSSNTVVVAHGHSQTTQQRVCLLEKDDTGPWTITWSYPPKGGSADEFNDIDEMAMDGDGILYVTDQNNQRVLLLDVKGQYLDSVDTRKLPYRICYSKHYRRLLVGHHGAISIYKHLGTGKEMKMQYQQTVVCESYSPEKDFPISKSLKHGKKWKMGVNPIPIGENIIRGMAELNNKLYIVMQEHSSIRVFDRKNSFKELSPIETENDQSGNSLSDPWFIGACPINNCLYITDRKRKCILKVAIQDTHPEIFKSDLGDPFKLSVTSNGRILIPIWPSGLEIYNTDGSLHESIDLPSDMLEPYHAIQVKEGAFIVSHGDKKSELHRVCEVRWSKRKGSRIVWSYGYERGKREDQLNRPRNVATDGKGRIFVTDEGNRRIIQLDGDGKLLSKSENLSKTPERMCYSSSVDEILVGGYGFIDRYYRDKDDQIRFCV